MTSLTQNKVLRSIRLKSMLLCSRLFPNVKEFAVTLATAICTLYFLVVLEKKSGGAAVPMKLVSTGGSHLDDFLRGKVTSDGAWCWFADPRAIYFKGAKARRTYVGWVNKLGDILIGALDHDSMQVLPSVTLRRHLNKDDHANPSLMILQDGRIMVFYSAHNGKNMYYRISRNPEDISEWGKEYFVDSNTNGKKGYTYPNPMILDQGTSESRLTLFWRGGSWKPTLAQVSGFNGQTPKNSDSWTWANSIELIVGAAARPYIKFEHEKLHHDKDKVHMAFTDGHPRDVATNSIYYACMTRNHLQKADGTLITSLEDLPIEPRRTDVVYNGKKGRAWIWDIAVDKNDRSPVLVYARFPEGKHNRDHRYHYARWNPAEQKWKDTEMIAAGPWFPQTLKNQEEKEPHYSPGITLDHSNPNRLVMSRLSLTSGQFEIELWITTDKGSTWTQTQVTRHSKQLNVRPIIPRQYSADVEDKALILWMTGTYQYWTNYSTSINYAFV